MEKVREAISKNPFVLCSDNELLFFKRDFCNSCRVVSTGEPDLFLVEKSIRKGIVSRQKESLENVANLYVEFMAEMVTPEKNLLFPKGAEDAVAICQEVYQRDVVQPAPSNILEKKRGYKSLHSSEYIESV